jgi:DNA-binding MarR family transcriptional regulator
MQNVQTATSSVATLTPQSLLKQAEVLQAQAAELAEIITRSETDVAGILGGANGPAALVKGIIHARNQRAKFLPISLFADPAWDILLELYSAEVAQQRMSVSQVCRAARVPATTALRWVGMLKASGLLKRHSDPLDARRSFVSLTEVGEQAMALYFASLVTQ